MREGEILPTTTRITKEMILNAAFEITRHEGIERVSNREIAKKMNISRSYVSRLEKRAITKILREFIKNKKI